MAVSREIYVSAVSTELKSAREAVAAILRRLGYEPVWQEASAPAGTDPRDEILHKLEGCRGVIQLVGRCYGAEPSLAEQPFGRTSYTQHEALYARQAGRPVWHFILEESFPTDPHAAEPELLHELQARYRRRVLHAANFTRRSAQPAELELEIFRLRAELGRARRGILRR
jgi:hypothetical protein